MYSSFPVIIIIIIILPQQWGDPVIIYNGSIIDVTPFPLDMCCEVADVKEKTQELRDRTGHLHRNRDGKQIDEEIYNTMLKYFSYDSIPL